MMWSRALLIGALIGLLSACTDPTITSRPGPSGSSDSPRADPAPSTSAEFLTAIRAAVGEDSLGDALTLAETAAQRFPTATAIGIERAKLLLLLDRADESLAVVRALPHDDAAVLEFHGYVELVRGNLDASRPLLEQAVAATSPPHPLAAMARYRLGLLDLRAGRLPAALESFRAATKLEPGLIEAIYHTLGTAERLADAKAASAARADFRDRYEAKLIQTSAFVDPVYDEQRPIDRGANQEWRPAVGSLDFEREFPAGSGVEVACRVPAGAVALFRVSIIAGPGRGEVLLAGLHRAAPELPAPWFPHLLQLPPGAAGQMATVRFEVLPGPRLARLLRRDPPSGAAFSEPGVVNPAAGSMTQPGDRPSDRPSDRPGDRAGGRAGDRPNVLLISLDTLRADRLGSYGGRSDVSPAIDRLAAAGVRFARLESTSNWTLPAHYSMMTGLTPAAHGVNPTPDKTRGYVNPGEKVSIRGSGRELMLAEAFAAAGYRTAAVTENAWVTGRFGFDQGFRLYRNSNTYGLPGTRAAVLADLDQFATHGPWLLFLHTYATHQPYHAPRAFRTRYADPAQIGFSWPAARVPVEDYRRLHHAVFPTAPSDQIAFRALYDGQVAWADTLVEAVIASLQSKGVLQNTIVAITSDHGEELFERGGFDHGDTLYEEVTHVPLIVHAPGRVPGGVVLGETVSLIDLPATLLDLAGLGTTHGAGRSLRPLWEGTGAARPVFAEAIGRGTEPVAACWDGALKYQRREMRAGRKEWLFDLAADPGERRDLGAVRAEDLRRLRALYDAHAESAAQVASTLGASEDALTEEDLERLRSLGYVQ